MERLKRDRDARQALKEDMEMISRDKDRQTSDFRHTEEEFHLNQAKLRSQIRIKEGRSKPIDLLARYTPELNKKPARIPNVDDRQAFLFSVFLEFLKKY